MNTYMKEELDFFLQMAQSIQFLHQLGVLQHFNSEALQDRVVIDPQWIVDVMACVVSVKDSPIKVSQSKKKHVIVSVVII